MPKEGPLLSKITKTSVPRRYGILKIKTEHERTVVFSPPDTFQVFKMYQVCLKKLSLSQLRATLPCFGMENES